MPIGTSFWNLLEAARRDGEEAALRRLEPYLGPLADYARRRGAPEALASHVGRRICDPDFLASARRHALRLRPAMYLLLVRELRGAAWESMREDPGGALEVRAATDAEFDRLWSLHLLRSAAAELARREPALGETVRLHYGEDLGLAEIEKRTGRRAADDLARARPRLRALLRSALAEYAGSSRDLEAEVSDLLGRV